jgi:chaperonin GroES
MKRRKTDVAKKKAPKKKMTKSKKSNEKKSSAKKISAKKISAKKSNAKKISVKKKSTKKTVAVKASKKKVNKPVLPVLKKTAFSAPQRSNADYSKVVTPLGDRIVLRQVNQERVSAGGIIIPDSANTNEGHLKGEVLACGVGSRSKKGAMRPLDVKVGDTVLFPQFAGTTVQFNKEDLVIIHESEVLGIVQNSV